MDKSYRKVPADASALGIVFLSKSVALRRVADFDDRVESTD